MSGRKVWAAALVLFVGIFAGVIYVWMSHYGAPHQSVVDKTISPPPVKNPVVGPQAAPSSSPAATYVNARFGYALDFPSPLLIAGNEADNSDGLKFVTEKGDADIRVWGEYNINDDSPEAILKFNLTNDCAAGKATYRISKPNLVAYSCLSPKGRVVYRKTVIHGETLATVRFDYAPNEQQKWVPAIKQMADSLRLDGGRAEQEAR